MQVEEMLKEAFEQFRQDPYNTFVVAVRRTRAEQIRELFANPEAITLKTFEREVWNFETETYWRSLDMPVAIFPETKKGEYIQQLITIPSVFHGPIDWTDVETALASGDLELHGNYIWHQGSRGYDISRAKSEEEKVAQIQQAISILNSSISPAAKVYAIRQIDGFGENNATGLVMIFHSNNFALVNSVTRRALEIIGISQNASNLDYDEIQAPLQQLKEQLGAQDFLELDWFLYLIKEGKYFSDPYVDISLETWLDYIVRVLQNADEPLSDTEIANQALALGLKTRGKTPARTASRTLTTNPQLFERVGRGKYRLLDKDKAPDPAPKETLLAEDTEIATDPPASIAEDIGSTSTLSDYVEPAFVTTLAKIQGQGMRIDEHTLQRYHLSLKVGRIVILAGPSGTGKTWLAQAYADEIGAAHRLVPVAPNWTTNEDLLGYTDPFDDQKTYHDTPTSSFLRQAAQEYEQAKERGFNPRPYHLILDEMNLARVEYYFAKILSIMEVRARQPDQAYITLGPQLTVSLYPNIYFVGTINVDETTQGFSDKVYDRAEVISLQIDPVTLEDFIGEVPYRAILIGIWHDVHQVAPFAFRVVKGINDYISEAEKMDVAWQVALDDQVLQKILPRVKGVDKKVGTALEKLAERITIDILPRSNKKVLEMLNEYNEHGISSYF